MKSNSKIYRDGIARGRELQKEEDRQVIDGLKAEAFAALDLVARVRQAIGDHGSRMQPELLEYCRELAGCGETSASLKPNCSCPHDRPRTRRVGENSR